MVGSPRQLDQDHALAGPGQEVDVACDAEHRPRLRRRGDDDLGAGRAGDPDHLGAGGRPCEPTAGPRARFEHRLEAEPQAVAVARDGDGVYRWGVALAPGRDVRGGARVETQRRHDALAVLQLEEPLDRLPVAGRGGHVGDPRGVGDAEVGEKDHRGACASAEHRQQRIPLAQPGCADVTHLLLTLHPAVRRDEHDGLLGHDEVVGAVLDLLLGALDQGPARVRLGVAIRLLDLTDLPPYQGPPLGLLLEQAADLPGTRAFGRQLLTNDQDLESCQPIHLQLEDGVGLFRVEREAFHDPGGGVCLPVGLADQTQHLVQGVEHDLEPLENVDAASKCGELVFQTPGDDVEPEPEKVPQHLVQIQPFGSADLRLLGRHQTGQVHGEICL